MRRISSSLGHCLKVKIRLLVERVEKLFIKRGETESFYICICRDEGNALHDVLRGMHCILHYIMHY